MRFPMRLAVVAGAFALWTSPVDAQYTTASLGGNVIDPNNAVLPQARVTVRNVQTGFAQTAVTDETGAFLFPRLPVGSYELRVERSGFSTYLQTGITLTVNQAANQTVVMQIGQVTEQVTVEADAELVVTRSGTMGQLIDQKRVVELPLERQDGAVAGISGCRDRGPGA